MALIVLTSIGCIIYLALGTVLTHVMFCWRQRERKLDPFFFTKISQDVCRGEVKADEEGYCEPRSRVQLSFFSDYFFSSGYCRPITDRWRRLRRFLRPKAACMHVLATIDTCTICILYRAICILHKFLCNMVLEYIFSDIIKNWTVVRCPSGVWCHYRGPTYVCCSERNHIGGPTLDSFALNATI